MTIGSALSGAKVVYLAAPGPVPFAMLLLSDLGADIVRVDRPSGPPDLTGLATQDDPRSRGQRGVGLNLEDARALAIARELIDRADVFCEGMRPGAAERMGLDPDDVTGTNGQLIHARIPAGAGRGRSPNRPRHQLPCGGRRA